MKSLHAIPAGSWTLFLCDNRDALYNALDRPLSYLVRNYFFSPAFKARRWDGRMHLLRKGSDGSVAVPLGLTGRAILIASNKGYTVTRDPEPDIGAVISPEWTGKSLRDYQVAAVAAAVAAGRGLLNLPIRSGKTLLAARVIYEMKRKTLFCVSSRMLLDQAVAVFQESLRGIRVTRVGDGEWDASGDVVVATMQTLVKHRQEREFAALAREYGVVFVDECHHTCGTGDAWRDVIIGLEARHKFGLSATFKLSTKDQNETESIWLQALCGDLLYKADFSALIDRGFLARPLVRFHRHNAPDLDDWKVWSQSVVADGIVSCEARNNCIAWLACEAVRRGSRVLVDAGRIKHVRVLAGKIADLLPPGQVYSIIGATDEDTRKKVLVGIESGSIKVVVGTVLGEGIDLPHLDVVINAEGGKAEVSTVQRLRNLTACEGKGQAIIEDFIDDHHRYLHKWSRARFRIYSAEGSFDLSVQAEDGSWVTRGE